MFTFKKEERLWKKKQIGELFIEGSSFYISPLKIYWRLVSTESEFPAQTLITVSKRSFPRAVDRNRIKRLLREAYRLQKPKLYEYLNRNNAQCIIAFIYTSGGIISFQSAEKKIIDVIDRLKKEIDKQLNIIPQ